MAGIRGKDTRPEMILRRGLHAKGFRYRLHSAALPGKPDLVFPSRKAVILIHGCFWHGHDCPLFRWPGSRTDFWRHKIEANRARDRLHLKALRARGWRVLTIWECALKGRDRHTPEDVINAAAAWLRNDTGVADIRGKSSAAC